MSYPLALMSWVKDDSYDGEAWHGNCRLSAAYLGTDLGCDGDGPNHPGCCHPVHMHASNERLSCASSSRCITL